MRADHRAGGGSRWILARTYNYVGGKYFFSKWFWGIWPRKEFFLFLCVLVDPSIYLVRIDLRMHGVSLYVLLHMCTWNSQIVFTWLNLSIFSSSSIVFWSPLHSFSSSSGMCVSKCTYRYFYLRSKPDSWTEKTVARKKGARYVGKQCMWYV